MMKRKSTTDLANNKSPSSSKRLKGAQSTNTLLNYKFTSNRLASPTKKSQSSDDKTHLVKDCYVDLTEECLELATVQKDTNAFQVMMQASKQPKQQQQTPTTASEELALTENDIKNYRKCPFYKRIEGTRIVVDAFSYGEVENCDAYFLSHFHSDHYMGLNKYFRQRLYCSQITANLVTSQLKVNDKYITVLPLNQFVNVYENNKQIQVALIEANHCPGSVMFLFRVNQSKYILHTGDFRATDEMLEHALLKNVRPEILYLDTTYCDSYYRFPNQSDIIALGIRTVKEELKKYPKALVVCGSYTIGKERIFLGIAEALSIKVCVTYQKKKILDCLKDPIVDKLLTLNQNETNLHVLSMDKLNIRELQEYISNKQFNYVIALKPTGWTHNSTSRNGLSVEAKTHNVVVYGLSYSEHSSFDELKRFVTQLKPKRITPTVNVGQKEEREKMKKHFAQWT